MVSEKTKRAYSKLHQSKWKNATKIPFFLLIFTGFVMSNNEQEYHPSKGEQLVNSIVD